MSVARIGVMNVVYVMPGHVVCVGVSYTFPPVLLHWQLITLKVIMM